jgi:prepilin-type N-terminal cleavage/methylation domain-containing protein
MRKILNSNKGFTLGELITVVAIIGILAGVVLPTFVAVAPKVKRKIALSEMRTLAASVTSFYDTRTANAHGFDVHQSIPTGIVGNGFITKLGYTTTTKCWLCGTYNPDTHQWEDAYEEDGSAGAYVYDGVTCQSSGEFFIRWVYQLGADVPSSEVKFPEDHNGYEWYIEFEPKMPEESDYLKNLKPGDTFYDEYVCSLRNRRPVGTITVKSSDPELSDIFIKIEIR